MRVLFVYPSIDCPAGVSHGIASLSAVLKRGGHETALIHVCEHLWPIPENREIIEGVFQFSKRTARAWGKAATRWSAVSSP